MVLMSLLGGIRSLFGPFLGAVIVGYAVEFFKNQYGDTQFHLVAMGLLPNIARDLLPGLYAGSVEDATAHAGIMISAYALGVVVGAPTIAATTSHLPRKKLLLILLAAFLVGTIASAILPSFGLVVLARFVAGLPHGAYFGIASLAAAFAGSHWASPSGSSLAATVKYSDAPVS